MAVSSAQPELPGLAHQAPFERLAFRQTDYDVPFWARSNSQPGRWNKAGDAPTQYWSLHPDGAWAEFVRQEELTDPAAILALHRPIWVCRISLAPLVDLREDEERVRYGVTAGELVSSDWTACQRLGRRLRADGAPGVLAPSAALAGHDNLTIFGPRRAIALHRRPVLHSTVPAAVVARGAPEPGLVERVRQWASPDAPDRLF